MAPLGEVETSAEIDAAVFAPMTMRPSLVVVTVLANDAPEGRDFMYPEREFPPPPPPPPPPPLLTIL